MTSLHVHQRVADYQAWKRQFDQVLSWPVAADVRSYRVWQSQDDPSLVVVEYRFESREAAESFIHSPEVERELALAAADDSTELEYLDEVAVASFQSP